MVAAAAARATASTVGMGWQLFAPHCCPCRSCHPVGVHCCNCPQPAHLVPAPNGRMGVWCRTAARTMRDTSSVLSGKTTA